MKIGHHHHSESLPQPAALTGTADAAGAKSTGRSPLVALQDPILSTGSPVSISSTAQTLASTAAGSSGDFDADKVSAVRDAINNGTYQVNPEVIADKLLSNAQDMLNRASPRSS